jgi:RNA polymerase sigma factor (sigma-70 family)
MADNLPPVLIRLLTPEAPSADHEPWAEFVRLYSRLLLHVARSLGGGHDIAMDRYTFILEQLRRDGYRRLRHFIADGRSEFSTWLVVVAQRLCLDHHRQRYGRPRAPLRDGPADEEEWRARRRLVDLVTVEIDLEALRDGSSPGPEEDLDASEAHRMLVSALARLTPRDRLLVRLRFEDELPMPEIARVLGFPTRFHAYRRLAAALAALRRDLERPASREPLQDLARPGELSVSPEWHEQNDSL